MMMNSKLDRAKELLESLRAEVLAFLKSRPYRVGTTRDEKTRKLVYLLTRVDDVPASVSTLTGDVIQNLRSALDHAAYQIFVLHSSGSPRHIYFPIASDKEKYDTEKARKTDGMPQVAKDLIDSIQPYKEGNITLWQIHELNNIDKHRTLITSGSAFHSMDIGAHAMKMMMGAFGDKVGDLPKMPLFIKPADNLFPLSVGQELFIDGPDAEEIPDMAFVFQIVLNEPDIVEGGEVIATLEKMIGEVEKQLLLIAPLLDN